MRGLRLIYAGTGAMQGGPGERRDCANDSRCLGAFARVSAQFGLDDACHCPGGCPQYLAPSRDEFFTATSRREVA